MITYDSIPVYDSWGYTEGIWSGIDWMNWSIALRSHYDKTKADLIWAKAWLDGVSVLGGGYGLAKGSDYVNDSVPIDDRTFNTSFRNYLSAEGNELLYDAVFSGVGGEVGKMLSGTVDVLENVGSNISNTVKNIGDTTENLTAILKYALPILLILILIGVAVYVTKQNKTT